MHTRWIDADFSSIPCNIWIDLKFMLNFECSERIALFASGGNRSEPDQLAKISSMALNKEELKLIYLFTQFPAKLTPLVSSLLLPKVLF